MGESPELDLSDLPVACPVCGQVHERCRFTAGSVYCVRPGCRNPHHREPGVDDVATIQQGPGS